MNDGIVAQVVGEIFSIPETLYAVEQDTDVIALFQNEKAAENWRRQEAPRGESGHRIFAVKLTRYIP